LQISVAESVDRELSPVDRGEQVLVVSPGPQATHAPVVIVKATAWKAVASTLAIFVGQPSVRGPLWGGLQPASSTPGEFLRLRYAMPEDSKP
jgi:hypothetical protein